MEAVGTARLTDRIPAERAIAASIPSREIRDVLREPEATPELMLDVVAGDASREHGTISITWSRDELERLVEGAAGDDVVLTFDRNELRAAFDDVETHGVRTRAAVFAVAAVGVLGGSAAIASASEVADTGGAVPAATAATPSQGDSAALAALQARSEAMNVQAGTGAAAALEARSEAMNAAYGTGDTGAAAALQARSKGLDAQFGLTPADQAATRALEARGAAMDAAYVTPDTGSTGIVTDASTGGYATPPVADTGSGFEIQAPSPEDALIAGAALITIAGAAFAARRGTLHLPH